jgi:hypothetical protein
MHANTCLSVTKLRAYVLRASCYPFSYQDLPCFKSQVDDTFTTTNQAFYKDKLVVKELMNPQVYTL